ncbi:hypothetical protein M9H77_04217 [Catharanthus roseus]|uniref:Uncharacterized protein n=1 Tax=Catharanthus roseus TaxID=4058 RepID=A0ACC0CDM4_CATRO|nr:hypothetical protein M9H77_04217 [Catharanthus roseus]
MLHLWLRIGTIRAKKLMPEIGKKRFEFYLQIFLFFEGCRASSDSVDDSDSGEWIHLKRSVDRGGCGSIGLRGHRIMLCGGVRPPSGESGGARHRGVEATLMCLDSLRLPNCARNPFSGSSISIGWALVFGTYSLVPRGTQIPYSAAVDLVAGLGVSQMVSKHLGTIWHIIPIDGYIRRVYFETIKGLAVQGVEPGVSIKEDPSEAESDVEMLPEQEGAAPAPVDAEGMDTLAAGGSPVSLSPICGYCL